MSGTLINPFKSLVRSLGFDIVRYPTLPVDLSQHVLDVIVAVEKFTQTSPERIHALCQAVQYITRSKIPGSVVECGVWKGGSMMAVAYSLLYLGDCSRELYLFDTFEGMPAPSRFDISLTGAQASELLRTSSKSDEQSIWCYAPQEKVQQALLSTGYDPQKLHLIKGKVEDTVPAEAPDKISLLRLDTDWYESTHHELIHLFPRLSVGGVIIIDDYGHWQGVRQAVDEYIEENNVRLLLNRIDYTGRIGVKLEN
jgi:O-methyltransferase